MVRCRVGRYRVWVYRGWSDATYRRRWFRAWRYERGSYGVLVRGWGYPMRWAIGVMWNTDVLNRESIYERMYWQHARIYWKQHGRSRPYRRLTRYHSSTGCILRLFRLSCDINCRGG